MWQMPRRTIALSSTTITRIMSLCTPPPSRGGTPLHPIRQHTPTRWGEAVQLETPRSNGLDAIQLRRNEQFHNRGSAADRSADCEHCIRDYGMFLCQRFQSSAYVFELLGSCSNGVEGM